MISSKCAPIIQFSVSSLFSEVPCEHTRLVIALHFLRHDLCDTQQAATGGMHRVSITGARIWPEQSYAIDQVHIGSLGCLLWGLNWSTRHERLNDWLKWFGESDFVSWSHYRGFWSSSFWILKWKKIKLKRVCILIWEMQAGYLNFYKKLWGSSILNRRCSKHFDTDKSR